MKINRVDILNFRSFTAFDLVLAGRSALLIGENAGGKTSLLTAIVRALGRDLSFSRADFGDPALPIELRVTLSDLDDVQRGIFGNHVEFGVNGPILELEARALWNFHAEEAEVEHRFRRSGARSRRDERDAIPLQWLPSNRDAARMLQFGVTRNLMARLLEGLPLQVAVDEAIDQIREASDQLGRDAVLSQFLHAARNSLATLLPDVSRAAFTMGLSEVTPRDLLRQFELVVEHLGSPVPVSRQSSGVAELAVFVFAMKLAMQDKGTILLVDEPELSLHPQSQRALMRALGALQIQMLVATHSANLLARADPRSVVRLSRSQGGVRIVSPSALSDDEARRLSRFTSTQTAEAFFARAVVLVEGMSDQLALEAVAERQGRNLDAEGIAIVPIGGAKTIGSFLDLFGPRGFQLRLAGLCDEAEERDFAHGLERVGIGASLSRADMENVGFCVCVADLEDELIRALGVPAVEAVLDAQGELGVFRQFQQQPTQHGVAVTQQLRRFIGSRGRKIEYAPLLVDALDLAAIPAPLKSVLAHV